MMRCLPLAASLAPYFHVESWSGLAAFRDQEKCALVNFMADLINHRRGLRRAAEAYGGGGTSH